MDLPSAPSSFEVQSEVRLTIEPQRADTILLRRFSSEQQDIAELPGFVELFKKALNAVPGEDRLVGLTPQQLILALPQETLQALPEEHLDTLSDEVQEQIRRRLQEAAP